MSGKYTGRRINVVDGEEGGKKFVLIVPASKTSRKEGENPENETLNR